MKNKSPCLGCQQREPGCQSRCELGITYSKQCKEQKEKIKAEKSRQCMIESYRYARILETRRRYGLE